MNNIETSSTVGTNLLGVFEGECADSAITNANGLDITRPVWEKLFASDDFKRGIENGWYIGFLGHPQDVDCQDFQNGCIVMTEGYIDSDNKVYGKFNLIDTPVGRIVKSFIDAGVKFGISVRGAGDIYSNSVDPDTFDFRGFDLVAFPAFPNAIPVFSAISASTDMSERKKYQTVCASVMSNIADVDSIEALEFMKTQFAPQSDTYDAIIHRIEELNIENESAADLIDVNDSKIDGLMSLYLEKFNECEELKRQISALSSNITVLCNNHRKKLNSIHRITSAQSLQASKRIEELENIEDSYADMQKQLRSAVMSSKESSSKCKQLQRRISQLEAAYNKLEENNLKYNRKLLASKSEIEKRDYTISELKSKLNETVNKSKVLATKSSNLDEKMSQMSSELTRTKSQLAEFQSAYAQLYANAVGADINNVPINASTTVRSLQQLIGTINTSEEFDSSTTPYLVEDDNYYDDELITI